MWYFMHPMTTSAQSYFSTDISGSTWSRRCVTVVMMIIVINMMMPMSSTHINPITSLWNLMLRAGVISPSKNFLNRPKTWTVALYVNIHFFAVFPKFEFTEIKSAT